MNQELSCGSPEAVKGWFENRVDDQSVPEAVMQWFQSEVSRNFRLFFFIAYSILGRSQDAEDAVQEAALKALRNLRQLEAPNKLVSWLAQITRRCAIDLRRAQTGDAAISLEDFTETSDIPPVVGADPAEQCELRIVLLEEISRLPISYSQVLLLRYLEDLDAQEIGQRLGIKSNAAQVRLFRAYQALRRSERLQSLLDGKNGWIRNGASKKKPRLEQSYY